jgi:steroid 5-alpha reductase family enzyme
MMSLFLTGLSIMLIIGAVTWLLSLCMRDVSIVDSIWSLMFLAAAIFYAANTPLDGRSWLVLTLVAIWALRLAIHLTWRNWGEPEDRRYREIREKYSPYFAIKSLFIIFVFQAVLASIVALPILPAISQPAALGLFDAFGLLLWLLGMGFEVVGDWQLARFKANPDNQGKVMQSGLWRYTRHPNYFGEWCIWWGFYLFAIPAGGWWTIISPLLMTFLLLRFSGVSLLEKDIKERRPAYRDYIQRTNAFFPGPEKISGA